MSSTTTKIFDGEQVALGGRVVSCREEIETAIFFFCDSMWDTDFIAIWYNETFRVGLHLSRAYISSTHSQVLSKRYIFDCASMGFRPPEEGYALAGKTSKLKLYESR
ncbi:hypothetical protein B0H19DRAFT_1277044 [Mycena capillaripes]|nr:hypothetical protein B0H19DRAFT_1277044 [Mycena capillaripes]